ncbi:YopX family protein [Paenibacillus sp. FSL R7-0331]|uniref:YopX family protein n=1 Tax=Paenibacillus sp. FSL R7-0331 TaxID=1536773 RepID=UPI00069452A3|nr:YopX family protein [Paenibacillus sp. FSL R7-0331]
MNREIKFRAWDPARKSMENCISISPFGVDDCDRRRWEWNEIEVMQYTGVKDCNGRVIYEGDIARHAVGWVGKVQYFEGSFEIEAKHQSWPINYVRGRKIEVIGNIYENPELLGGEVAEA